MARPHSPLAALAVVTLLLGACAPAAEEAAPAAAEPVAAAPSPLEHPARSDDDRYRDQGFKPLEVYDFFGVEEGMTVADLMPSRGYNTVLLSQIVGDAGSVVAVLGPYPADEERTARRRESLQSTLTEADLTNVEIAAALEDVPDGSVDLLLTVRNYHDLGEAAGRSEALPHIMRVLRPGGVFAAVDAHTDKTDERDESVHRINEELARSEIEAAGFEFAGSSPLLYNPDDTYDFDGREREGVRGATENAPIHRYFIHRWVLKFQKPA